MSDIEEPPTKVAKFEMSQTFTQPEEMDTTHEEGQEEGQEEWLSEGLLTDDDTAVDQDNNASQSQDTTIDSLEDNAESMEATAESLEASADNVETNADSIEAAVDSIEANAGNIEATADSIDATADSIEATAEIIDTTTDNIEATADIKTTEENKANAESIEATAVRESNAKIDAKIELTLNSMDSQSGQGNDPFDQLLKQDQNEKKEDSDGNDTDDLLRMLEDDDKTKKAKVMKKTKHKAPAHDNASSDEDDATFIYQNTTVKKVRIAKDAVIQKYPTKAMPETTDDDETDASAEDVHLMQKMFRTKQPTAQNAKSAQKETLPARKQFVPKKVVRVGNANSYKQVSDKRAPASSTPLPRPVASKSLLKPNVLQNRFVSKFNVSKKPEVKKMQAEHEEIINEEEFLEEDGFDLDEDFAEESDTELEKRRVQQRIMRPEQMDEEMLSDAESESDDGGVYDELPSSESDDMEEWFALDIRAERAGDYLPLLGSKAYELLTQEKSRVATHISSLRQSLSSLSAGSRRQAEKLKTASQTLAEIDDALKAH